MKPIKVYACYNKCDKVRLNSSSGAIFSALAEYVINNHGIVYGVTMSEDCTSAIFISTTDFNGVNKMRGSKYMQAKIGDTFNNVKADLQSGKIVLFTGTGCQINGLKKFLGKNYKNLICMDLVCHGVPSPALWKKYVEYQEKRYNGRLKKINFRCKDENWFNFGMKEIIDNCSYEKEKKIYISKDTDAFMQMFLRNYCLRPSCYDCVAKKIKMSDLTVADFWGINNVAPEMNDGLGTSLVLIRSDLGENVFNAISTKLNFKEVTYKAGVSENPAEYKSCERPPQRADFFSDMNQMSFETLKIKYASPVEYSLSTQLIIKLKKTIKSIIQ